MFRPCWSGWCAARQAHRKHRTLARLAPHGHVAAHQAREFARDAKAQPGAAVALRRPGIGLAELLETSPAGRGTISCNPALAGGEIYGPKDDGTYAVEFRTAGGEALAISIPRTP
jgi:hypothetical protein